MAQAARNLTRPSSAKGSCLGNYAQEQADGSIHGFPHSQGVSAEPSLTLVCPYAGWDKTATPSVLPGVIFSPIGPLTQRFDGGWRSCCWQRSNPPSQYARLLFSEAKPEWQSCSLMRLWARLEGSLKDSVLAIARELPGQSGVEKMWRVTPDHWLSTTNRIQHFNAC